MTKTELRNIMNYSFPPIDEDDREEIDATKDNIRSEGGRDRVDERVEEEVNNARNDLVDDTITRLNEKSYGEIYGSD